MLNKHELPIAREEMERVDTLRYSWQKLVAQSGEVSTHLIEIQPNFKSELIKDVEVFVVDCASFYGDYHEVCVPVTGSCLQFANFHMFILFIY